MGKARIIIQTLVSANYVLRWLLTSSVWSPFIRLWNNLTALQAAAVISALVLTIGAIIEYWYKLKLVASLALKWILRKSTPFDRCTFKKLFLHSIGPILVVLGIAGEVVFEGRTFIVEDRQEEQAQKTVGSLAGQAQQADVKAKKAITDSSTALDKTGKAQKSADAADESARKAETKADAVSNQTDELTQKLAKDEQGMTELETRRVELEKSLENLAICNAPRVIPQWSMKTPGSAVTKTAVDPLRSYAGWQFVIEYVPLDAEARRAAASIVGALEAAGWKMAKASQVDGIDDGIEVRAYFNRKAEAQEWGLHVNSQEAVYTLIDFLHSYNWEVKSGWASDTDTDIPPKGIKIRVGLYPAVSYVNPPATKEFAAVMAQFEKDREKMRQQLEAERQKREEKFLEHLTPEQRNSYKARIEEFRKTEEQTENRYRSVCQPLEPLMPR